MSCHVVVPALCPGMRREVPSFHGQRSLYVPTAEGWVVYDVLMDEYIGKEGTRGKRRSDVIPFESRVEVVEEAYWQHWQLRLDEMFEG